MTLPFTDEDVATAFSDWNVASPAVGQGSFKVAYRVKRRGGAEEVLKILTDPISVDSEEFEVSEFSERLSRELTAMSETKCQHIVQITEPAGVKQIGSSRFVWYAEPYYSGGTLEERLQDGPLGLPQVIGLAKALLIAVESMWSQRIVHRDIKPGNIVFDNTGIPVLLDLGIALYSDLSPLTSSWESSPMTPRYSSPEQFEARKDAQIDFRTDHFLIGMVVFESLTGKHPFWTYGVGLDVYMKRLENFSVDSLAETDAPEELKKMVSRLLAAKPNRRYRKVDEPLKELEGIL